MPYPGLDSGLVSVLGACVAVCIKPRLEPAGGSRHPCGACVCEHGMPVVCLHICIGPFGAFLRLGLSTASGAGHPLLEVPGYLAQIKIAGILTFYIVCRHAANIIRKAKGKLKESKLKKCAHQRADDHGHVF